ncbi:MAG: ClpXP protease specificity-enhancing factor [Betaproteobacteria bacterium]|nr:ClpXP protease specificity-enhancing factor [Betaproteobacteria bacterium]
MSELSTKPYLIRAIHEWCADSGYRAHIAVAVDETTRVPMEFVRNGEIVLNISADATNRLQIGNELIEFEARFNRIARQVSVPIANVSAIYAAETGHGMAFDVAKPLALAPPPAPAPGESGAGEPAAQADGREPASPASPVSLVSIPTAGSPSGAADAPAGRGAPDTDPPPGAPVGGRPRLTRVK